MLGLYYQSRRLQEIRSRTMRTKVIYKVDRFDLGEISVYCEKEDAWLSVGYIHPVINMKGVSIWEWIEAAKYLRERHSEQEKLSANVVSKALLIIKQTADVVTKRAEIGAPYFTSAMYEETNRNFFTTFDISDHGQYDYSDSDFIEWALCFESANDQIDFDMSIQIGNSHASEPTPSISHHSDNKLTIIEQIQSIVWDRED